MLFFLGGGGGGGQTQLFQLSVSAFADGRRSCLTTKTFVVVIFSA